MTEKRSVVLSIISYVVAGALFLTYLYLSVLHSLPFLRAGVLAFVCVFMYAGTRFRIRKSSEEKAQKQIKIAFGLMFVLYLSLLLTFLFFDGYFGRDSVGLDDKWSRESFAYYLQNSVHLIPLKETITLIGSYCKGWINISLPLINIVGNLVAFVPFALFLPMFFGKTKRALPFLCTVAGIVIAVELLQLFFQCGVCDIDDLIFNVSGAGFLFWLFHTKRVKKFIDKLTLGLY